MATLEVTHSPIIEDTPCPTCSYNLRGLLAPRCPECGLAFEWWDIYRFRRIPAKRRESRIRGIYGVLIAVVVLFLLIVGAAPFFVALFLLAGAGFALIFVQTAVEMSLVSFFPGVSAPGNRRFWALGAVIGDIGLIVASALTISLQRELLATPSGGAGLLLAGLMWAGAIAWATSTQYVMVVDVNRSPGRPAGLNRRLLVACALVKCFLAVGTWILCLPGNP